jgi:dolichyl-phosphate beta-glucosyltransferase
MPPYFPSQGALSLSPRFFLVIPAYREARRLPPFLRELQVALSGISGGVQIQIVDDGSPPSDWEALRTALDAEASRALSSAPNTCRVLAPFHLAQNTRKGGAILSGWLQAPAACWLAFLDADGAVPSHEVRRVFDEIGMIDTGAFFASRASSEEPSKEVRREPVRRLLSAIFATIVRCLLGVRVRDSQCGFKIVSASDFRRISAELKPHGFCFDLSLWLALRRAGVTVQEKSVHWEEQPGGHLSLLRHGPGIFKELWALRREYRTTCNQGKK